MKRFNNHSNKTSGFLTWWAMLTEDQKRLFKCFVGGVTLGIIISFLEMKFSYETFADSLMQGILGGSVVGGIAFPIATIISRAMKK